MQDWHEETQNHEDQKFQAELLALEHERLQLLREQNVILDWAVQAVDNNHHVLDTALALVVAFMLPTTWLPALAPHSP